MLCISLTGFAQESDFCVTYPSGKTLCYIITSPNTVAIGKNSNSNNGRYAFEGSISIPESVSDRGDTYTIWNVRGLQHTNLTSVKLSEKVTVIDSHAFWDCKKLTTINLPNSLLKINPCAFEDCSSLVSITIPNSVGIIGRRAFKNTGLTSVVIPASIELIGRSAFESCHNLQTATVGCNQIVGTENDDHEAAEDYTYSSYKKNLVGGAFENCENLQKVSLTNSVTHIGARTFRGCTNLREINIPNSVTYIGWRAFENCVSLRDVVIPEGVTTLGMDAFAGCRRLRTIKLPASLVKITSYKEALLLKGYHTNGEWDLDYNSLEERGVFYNCPSLEKIIIPFGSYGIFSELLPNYKDKFVEEEGRDNIDEGQEIYKSLYGRYIRDKLFYEYILRDCDGWEYIYLDNDSIPELMLYGNCRAVGCRILSVQNDTVIEETLGPENCYIPKSGLLYSHNGNMGYYDDYILYLNHGFSSAIELADEIDFGKVDEIREKTGNYGEAYYEELMEKFHTYYKKESGSEYTVITKKEYDQAIYSTYTSKGKSIGLQFNYDNDKQKINALFNELWLLDLDMIYRQVH